MSDDAERERARYEALAALVENYRRERDEARAETARLRRLLNMAEDELIAADDHGRREANRADTVEAEVEALKAERDEARAEVERWKRSCNVFRERDWPHAFQATVASLERELADANEQLSNLRKLSKPWEGDAYRRGAKAMREACAQWVDHWVSGHVADKLRDMPIPEDKP